MEVAIRLADMAKVFISHSKNDMELISNIATMLKNVDESPVVMEYFSRSAKDSPNWSLIRKHVSESEYLMLFKTDNAIKSDYTKSWIIYEVGLAAAWKKRLFVFERKGPAIKFPIPYLTDYMIFDPERVKDFLRIQSIVAETRKFDGSSKPYKDMLAKQFIPMQMVVQSFGGDLFGKSAKASGAFEVACGRCRSRFRYYPSYETFPFNCPVCLTPIKSACNGKTK